MFTESIFKHQSGDNSFEYQVVSLQGPEIKEKKKAYELL